VSIKNSSVPHLSGHIATIIFMLSLFFSAAVQRKLLAGLIKHSSLLDKNDNGRAQGVVISMIDIDLFR
jgi:hypothetical protein